MVDMLKEKKLLAPLIVVIVLVLAVILLSSLSGGSSSFSYENLEEKIKSAVEEYFKDNSSLLPVKLDEQVEIDVETLVSGGYMKGVNSYIKGSSCSGKGIVTYTNSGYVYKAFLDCGSDYVTTFLADVITGDVVSSGDGVYKVIQYNGTGRDASYVFRGENVNNYVSIGNELWRVVKVDSGNNVMIISDKVTSESYVWDDRYNIDADNYRGINNFKVSRIKDTLKSFENSVDMYVDLKKLIVPKSYCIGSRSDDRAGVSGSDECSEVIEGEYFSLLSVYDYMNASLDSNCKKTTDESCSNYNYLNNSYSFWLLTGNKENTSRVYYASGSINSSYADANRKIRIVAYLGSNTIYVSGTGSSVDPYIVR